MRTHLRRWTGRWWLVAALTTVVAVSSGTRAAGPAASAQGEVPGWYVKTHVYLTTTDGDGRFAVPHRLDQRCARDEIYGVTVAFRSRADGRYHGGFVAPVVHHAWNEDEIEGVAGPGEAFANVPVRILAFTTRRMC